MTAGGLLVFAGSLAIAGATPGPATMTVLARVLARGPRGTIAFCLGIVIGDLFWLATAALGLAAIAERVGPAMLAITLAGAAYLLVLARGFWTAPAAPVAPAAPLATTGWGVLQGLLLQLGNPKVVLFYVALLPALIPVGHLTTADFAALALVVTGVIAAVNTAYVSFAVVARRHVTSPRSLRLLHRIGAVAMVIAAAFLLWSAL